MRDVEAFIVMPRNAIRVKGAAAAGYGRKIVYCEATEESREQMLTMLPEGTDVVMVICERSRSCIQK
jgi:threonine dehydratase